MVGLYVLILMEIDIDRVYSQDRFSRFGSCTNRPSLMEQIQMERQIERKHREAVQEEMMECSISMGLVGSTTSISAASTSTNTIATGKVDL